MATVKKLNGESSSIDPILFERVVEFMVRCEEYRVDARIMLEQKRLLDQMRNEITDLTAPVPFSAGRTPRSDLPITSQATGGVIRSIAQ